MKKEQAKAEICRTRKSSGLSCNGCQYGEECEEKQQKETADGIPADIKPGTKQAKIYGLLKDGQTTKEIIATKEFAPESVYIVARKHFPDAITPNGKNVERVNKAKQGEDAALKAVKEFIEESEKKIEERAEEEEKPKPTLGGIVMKAIEEYMEPIKKYLEPPAEINPKIVMYERIIKEKMNWKDAKIKTMKYLEAVKTKLEQGELIEVYTMLQDIIEAYRKELEKEAEDEITGRN